MNRKHIALVLLLAITLGGLAACAGKTYKPDTSGSLYVSIGDDNSFYPNLDWLAYNGQEGKMKQLAKEDFSVAVGSVIDRRRPRAYTDDAEEYRVLHEYDPDLFLNSTTGFIQNELQRNMTYGPPRATVYVADVTLRDISIRILKGSLLAGRWGRYAVDMEFDVLVRDKDGIVVDTTPVKIKHIQRRIGNSERQPTEKQDRARIMQVIRKAFEPTGVHIAWLVRRGHLRRQGGDLSDHVMN